MDAKEFTDQQITFLETYRETMSETAALEKCGVGYRDLMEWKRYDGFVREMRDAARAKRDALLGMMILGFEKASVSEKKMVLEILNEKAGDEKETVTTHNSGGARADEIDRIREELDGTERQ